MNGRAIGLGAAIVVGVGVPVALVGALAVDEDSDLVFPLAAIVVAAFVVGGWYAARTAGRNAPLAAGALAAVAGFAVVQALVVVLLVVDDEDVRPAAIAANAVLAAGAGFLGAALGSRR